MYLEDFKLQMEIEIPPASVMKQKMVDFAKDYDPFPFHYDEAYAEKTQFGGLIAPGVMSFMTVWEKFVEINPFGDELVAGKSTKIEWFKAVFPGDILYGKARVTGIQPRNDYNGIVEITIEVHNQNGDLVLSDVTETIVKRRR